MPVILKITSIKPNNENHILFNGFLGLLYKKYASFCNDFSTNR